MATTEALESEDDRQVALLLLIDGVEDAFTDSADLVGYSTGESHTVRLGLQRDGLTYRLGLNLATGQLLDSPASITIVDFDGSLNRLFGSIDESERQLGDVPLGTGVEITPGEDLTARTGLYGLNVGLERIGPAGERHQYAVPPGFSVGHHHVITTGVSDTEGAPVSNYPIVWRGRRCALYMVLRDHIVYPDRSTGLSSWRPLSEARRLWWGTLQDAGTVSGREWTLDLDGPESLLRKPLASTFGSRPVRAVGEMSLSSAAEADETGMYMHLEVEADGTYGVSSWATAITGTLPSEIRDDVIAEIAAVSAATGLLGVWEDQDGYRVSMTPQGDVHISVSDTTDSVGALVLCLHRKVWAAIGYDVDEQPKFERSDEEPLYVGFHSAGDGDGDFATPGPGYYYAIFATGGHDIEIYPKGPDNGGITRVYRPLYPQGAQVLSAALNDGTGQVVRLSDGALGADTSQSTVAHPGQLAVPVAPSPTDPSAPIEIDGTPCNRSGYWLFVGKRRYAGQEEEFDERWVGEASWVAGTVQQAGLVSGDKIIVTRWLDARLFGFGLDGKGGLGKGDWAARAAAEGEEEGQVYAVPIVMLGYRHGTDRAHVVLQRLLYTTGTSTGWTGYGDAATLDPGDNEPAGAHQQYRDAEIADLGLAIPSDWIASPTDYQAEASKVEAGAILDVKVAFSSGYQAEDVCRSLMQPVGWSWHLRDGQYGIWCPADPITLADATVSLDRSTRSARYKDSGRSRLQQDLRVWAPVDLWKFEASWKPHDNAPARRFDRVGPDPQYRYRPGEVTRNVMAHAMRGLDNGLAERLSHLSRWWARRHFAVRKYPVMATRPGLDIWPGTIVRLTDPELVDPNGGTAYGVTNRLAIVTSMTRTFGVDSHELVVDLLVLADRTTTPRYHAVIARGVGYDSVTSQLYVADNWAALDSDTWSDAAAFAEPSYVGIVPFGGNAEIVCWQWDGNTWSAGMAADVVSVTTTAGGAYLTLANESGTYYRDMDTWVVLRPAGDTANAAWVAALFSPICDDAGQYVDSAAATQDGHQWEK